MTDQELRMAFIQALKMGEDDDLQMTSFMNGIFHYCMENEMITQEDLGRNVSFERFRQRGEGRPGEFDKKHWKKIAQWFWEFVARGIVITGINPHECNLPWFQVTEYGNEVLDSELEPIPEDTQGYIQYLKTKINDIDDVVLIYISEAIDTFRQINIFSSAVMIGAAAEKLFYLLSNSLINSLKNTTEKEKLTKIINSRDLTGLRREITMRFKKLIEDKMIPPEVSEGSFNSLFSIFDAIRIQRNNAVHPIVGEVTKDQLRLLLLSFPHACKKAYDFMNWLKENEI